MTGRTSIVSPGSATGATNAAGSKVPQPDRQVAGRGRGDELRHEARSPDRLQDGGSRSQQAGRDAGDRAGRDVIWVAVQPVEAEREQHRRRAFAKQIGELAAEPPRVFAREPSVRMRQRQRLVHAEDRRGGGELSRARLRKRLIRAQAAGGHGPALPARQRHDGGRRPRRRRERERAAGDQHLVVGVGDDRDKRGDVEGVDSHAMMTIVTCDREECHQIQPSLGAGGQRSGDQQTRAASGEPPPMTRSSFAVVYHRTPFDAGANGDMAQRSEHASPNGIIPTLRGVFGDDRPGLWVAWTQTDAAADAASPRDVALDLHGTLINVHRVPLTALAVQSFYYGFSKEALWPIVCSAPASAHFDEAQWRDFVDVNARFADAVVRLVEPDATIWVHDYNLWLVPGMLRSRMPAARIGFFHHTPFPAADIFAILPWRAEIVASLLACDLVGFDVPHFANNFAATAANLAGATVTRRSAVGGRFLTAGTALSTASMARELRFDNRRVGLGAFAAGVDSERIDAVRATPAHAERVARIGRELAGRQVVLSVERMDYVKGPVERLLAYERLLAEHPEYREAVVFVSIVAPAAETMAVHRALRDEVDMLVGRINGRFATLAWTPVRYFHQSLSFEEIVSWYAAASVAWITPLRDGLNLVSKEFVAASDGAAKVLILSEFAGAHVELQHAVTCQPLLPAIDGRRVADRARPCPTTSASCGWWR